MAHYQSIPAATHQANAEPEEETVQIHKSKVRWSVAGAVLLILCLGLGLVATTTQTSRSWKLFDVQEIAQLAGQGTTSSGTFCGTPCQDFDESVQTC